MAEREIMVYGFIVYTHSTERKISCIKSNGSESRRTMVIINVYCANVDIWTFRCYFFIIHLFRKMISILTRIQMNYTYLINVICYYISLSIIYNLYHAVEGGSWSNSKYHGHVTTCTGDAKISPTLLYTYSHATASWESKCLFRYLGSIKRQPHIKERDVKHKRTWRKAQKKVT